MMSIVLILRFSQTVRALDARHFSSWPRGYARRQERYTILWLADVRQFPELARRYTLFVEESTVGGFRRVGLRHFLSSGGSRSGRRACVSFSASARRQSAILP